MVAAAEPSPCASAAHAPFIPLTALHPSHHSTQAAPHIGPLSDAHISLIAGGHRQEAVRGVPRSLDLLSGAHLPTDLLGADPSGVELSAAGVGDLSEEEEEGERDCWHEVVIKSMVHPVDGR